MPKTASKPVACTSCDIYRLCYSVGGDTDLSVLDTIVTSRKTIKRGDFLYQTGKPFRAIYAIRGGSVKTSILADDGRIQVTGFHVAGKVLGLDAIVTSQYNCEATALETTMVCEVPFTRFQELSKEIPGLQYKILEIMSQDILDNRELMMLLGKMSAEERLATYLLSMSRRFERSGSSPVQFNMSMSRNDIGNYLGMAEETVCRILTRFQEEGLITTRRRQTTLNDPDRLRAVARRK
jgi:CRP/FNR family transcriptional regulator